jgi:hypothetical protein
MLKVHVNIHSLLDFKYSWLVMYLPIAEINDIIIQQYPLDSITPSDGFSPHVLMCLSWLAFP